MIPLRCTIKYSGAATNILWEIQGHSMDTAIFGITESIINHDKYLSVTAATAASLSPFLDLILNRFR